MPKEFSFRFNELIKSIKTSFISAIFDGRNVHVKGTSYSRQSRGISKLCRQNLRMTHRFMRWLKCAIDRLQKYSNAGIKCFYVQSYRFIDNKSVKENEERKWNSEIGKIVDPRYIIREIRNERDE